MGELVLGPKKSKIFIKTMNTVFLQGEFSSPPMQVTFNSDFRDLHQQHLETRCKIAWDTVRIGGYLHVPFNKSKSKPSVPERLKKQGYEFTVSKHNGTLYNGIHISGWVFLRIA